MMPFFKRDPKQKPKTKIVTLEEQVGIDKERCLQMMAAAESAVKARNFAQAEDLYSACLPIMEQIYAGDSKAMADCLTALGDVYYWQDKFGLALPIYQRLLSMRERMKDSSPASLVTAYLKNAKAQEHLSNIEAAQDMYKRGSEIAQKTLMLGHPLLSSILEAYANFLQERTANRGLADDMRRKAKISQETYVDPALLKSEAMEGKVREKAWKDIAVKKEKDPAIWKTAEEEESKHPLVKALRNLRKHPRLAIAFLTLPVSLGLLIVVVSATYYLTGGESVQVPIVHTKDIFRSADGQLAIEVLPDHRLSAKTFDDEVKVDYITLSNPWRELEYFYLESPKNDIIFYKDADSLVDSKGSVLESGTAPQISTIMDMERLGEGLHKANTLSTDQMRKGNLSEYCAQFSYENPYTHKKEEPNVLFAEFDTAARPEQLADYFKRARTFDPESLSKRFIVKFANGKIPVTRALIKCLVVPNARNTNKASFFIVATDDRGALLRQSEGQPSLLVSSIAGGAPEFNRGKGESAKIPASARVVISKVTKENISMAANLLAWIFVLLPIVLAGYKVFAPALNRSQYAGKESINEIWLSYVYVIALFAYICFFTGVVFFVMNL